MKILLDLWFGMFIIASVATAFAILADGLSCKKEVRTMSRFERFLKSALNRGYDISVIADNRQGQMVFRVKKGTHIQTKARPLNDYPFSSSVHGWDFWIVDNLERLITDLEAEIALENGKEEETE